MRSRPKYGPAKIAGCAALGAAAALAGLACGNGLFTALLTIGISALFAGTSPGYALRDPAVTGVPATPEPDFTLQPSQPVERALILGGDLEPTVGIDLDVSNAAPSSELSLGLFYRRADGTNAVPVTSTSVPTGGSTQILHQDFVLSRLNLFPGDAIILRMEAIGGSLTIAPTSGGRTRFRSSIFLNREVKLALLGGATGGTTGSLAEEPPAAPSSMTVPSGTTGTARYELQAIGPSGLYGLAGTPNLTTIPDSIEYEYDGIPRFSLYASTNTQTADFTLELDRLDARLRPMEFLGNAGPFTATTAPQRFEGTFAGGPPGFSFFSSQLASESGFIGLRISVAGPQRATNLTIGFDPSDPAKSSYIMLPGPRVYMRFGGMPPILVSQPDPQGVFGH